MVSCDFSAVEHSVTTMACMGCTVPRALHVVREPLFAPALAVCLCCQVHNPLCLVVAFFQGLQHQALAKRGQRSKVLDGLMTCSHLHHSVTSRQQSTDSMSGNTAAAAKHTLLAKVHYPATEQQHQAVKEAEGCNPPHTQTCEFAGPCNMNMTGNMLCKLMTAKSTPDCIPACAPVGVGEWIVAQTVMPVLASLFTIIMTCTAGLLIGAHASM